METFSEIRSKYYAFAITIGIHLLLGLLFLLMGFVNPKEKKPLIETFSGELGVFGFDVIDLNDLVVNSKAPSSEKLISDPNEEQIKIEQGNSSAVSEPNVCAENSEYEAVLSKWNQIKNKKTQKGNSKGCDLKDGNSFKKNTSGFENDGSFILANRSLVNKPETILNAAEEGKVVVEIIVNENGKVISAVPGQRGSTTTSAVLYNKAVKSAFTAQFDPAKDDIKEQRGTYTFVFNLE